MKFKPGQKLLCVDNEEMDALIVGQIYTCLRHYDCVVELRELQQLCAFWEKRFVDAESYLQNKKFNNKLKDIINE
jgi:hypothetical protein